MAKRSKKPPKFSPFWNKIFAYLGLGIMLSVALGFTFFGFMKLKIDCERPNLETKPNCEVDEYRFFGLYSRKAFAEKVSGTSYLRNSQLESTVVLDAENGQIRLSAESSNFGAWKKETASQIDSYLNDKKELTLKIDYFNWNFVGVIGIGLLLIFATSFLYYLAQRLKGLSVK